MWSNSPQNVDSTSTKKVNYEIGYSALKFLPNNIFTSYFNVQDQFVGLPILFIGLAPETIVTCWLILKCGLLLHMISKRMKGVDMDYLCKKSYSSSVSIKKSSTF